MQYHELLAKFIRNSREKTGLSLNSFSYKNGIEPSTLSRIENGKLEVKMSTLTKIAKGFELKPSEFLNKFEEDLPSNITY